MPIMDGYEAIKQINVYFKFINSKSNIVKKKK